MTWAEEWIILPFLTIGDRMFALLALICFVIAQFETALGQVDMTLLGLAFIAAHLLLGGGPFIPWRKS
jgi:hypothetical protein